MSPQTQPRVTLTPLIDTALVLLVIFMVTAPLVQQAIKVELPTGSVQEGSQTPSSIELYIDAQGNTFTQGQPVAKEQLIQQLRTLFENRSDKTLIIKSDRAVSYGTVIELVDSIKFEGIVTDVVLATEKHTSRPHRATQRSRRA